MDACTIDDDAYRAARKYHRHNYDPAVTQDDLAQENRLAVLMAAKRASLDLRTERIIVRRTSIDQNRRAYYRAHVPLHELEAAEERGSSAAWDGSVPEKHSFAAANRPVEDEVLWHVSLEATLPLEIVRLIRKRLAGYPLEASERTSLYRYLKRYGASLRQELFNRVRSKSA